MSANVDPPYFLVRASKRSVEEAIRRFVREDPYYSTLAMRDDVIQLSRLKDTGETIVHTETGGELRTNLFAFLRGFYSAQQSHHPWRFGGPGSW